MRIATAQRPLLGRVGFSAFTLKVIALSLMVAEHVSRFLAHLLPAWVPLLFVGAGRVVFPLFLFLVVESVFRTSDRRRYLLRLWVAAAVMAAGNLALGYLARAAWPGEPYVPLEVNIFASLALAASFVMLAEEGRRTPGPRGVAIMCVAALAGTAMLFTEGSALVLACTLIFYVLRGDRRAMLMAYALFSVAIGVLVALASPTDSATVLQGAMILATPLIASYDGTRGRPVKWLFYAVYPLHLWVLYLLSYATGGGGVAGP